MAIRAMVFRDGMGTLLKAARSAKEMVPLEGTCFRMLKWQSQRRQATV
jgi:hypothetical protein